MQRRLKEVVNKLRSYPLSRDVETEEITGYKYIHYGDIHKQVADIVTNDDLLPNIKNVDYIPIEQGDLVLADASEDYSGIAEPCVILHKPKKKIIAGLHTIAIRPINTNPMYLYYLLHTEEFKKFGSYVGTGLKVFGITFNNFAKYETKMPMLPEQTSIGNFFHTLDKIVDLYKRKAENLKQLKKAYLQQMFPQEGEAVPKVRFSGFKGDWEKVTLNEMLVERNEQIEESDKYPLMSFVGNEGVVPKGEQYDRSFLVKDVNKKYKKTELNDFIYSSNNLETGSIGFNRTGSAVISPVYSIFYSINASESQFVGLLSNREDFINRMIHYRQGVMYGQWRIHEKDFLQIVVLSPSIMEQNSIIQFFHDFDKQIAAQTKKHEQLKQLKSAYLQKMFI